MHAITAQKPSVVLRMWEQWHACRERTTVVRLKQCCQQYTPVLAAAVELRHLLHVPWRPVSHAVCAVAVTGV